jgi:hypothetical protein
VSRADLILEPAALLGVAAATAALAAAVPLALAPPGHRAGPARAGVGGVLGAGLGLFTGWWFLAGLPHWPPTDAEGRLFFFLLPAAVTVELAAALPAVPRRLAWLLRLVVVAGAAPVLLYRSVYLADLAGPGSREWSPEQAGRWLVGLGAALAVVRALLAALAHAAPGRSPPASLAVACLGAAQALADSGCATAAPPALALAAAVLGAGLASPGTGPLGVGLAGLFGLLALGRFFGGLPTGPAALLLAAPLLGWLPEAPPLRWLGPRWRGGLRVALAAAAVAAAVAWAREKPADRPAPPEPRDSPTLQDYRDFRPSQE